MFMKYKNIVLNGNKKYQYSLKKYERERWYIFDYLKNINEDLLRIVKESSISYSENSDYQAYMLVRNEIIGVGVVIIDTNCDEKDLEVLVQLDEEQFRTEKEMEKLIDQLIDSLALYCYDKENIVVDLRNDIDLEKYNEFKYIREILFSSSSTFKRSNNYYNTLLPLLIREMKDTHDVLTIWRQSWWEELELVPDIDLDDSKNKHVTYDEIFNKALAVKWSNIKSHNAVREITFNIDGDISLSKLSKFFDIYRGFIYKDDLSNTKIDSSRYKFNYNLLKKGFKFENNLFSIKDDRVYTKIKARNLEIMKLKEANSIRITYKSDIIDNSSLTSDIYLDGNNEIEKCHVLFTTYGCDGKFNGNYLLDIENGTYSLVHLNKKGDAYNYINDAIYVDHDFSLETLDNRINGFINDINEIYCEDGRYISLKLHIPNLRDATKYVVDTMKQIEEEIPLPYLSKQVDSFISANELKISKVKKLQ